MSLTGNLEDLPLLDILQIVSFSQKTGYLIIRRDEGEGAVVFRDGLVSAAFTWDTVPPDQRTLSMDPDRRETAIRSRIEAALARLARLREGQFNFNLTDVTPQTVAERDITAETLDPGLNAQELLIDLARGIDEDRRDSSAALEASFDHGVLSAEAAGEAEDTHPPGLGGLASELVTEAVGEAEEIADEAGEEVTLADLVEEAPAVAAVPAPAAATPEPEPAAATAAEPSRGSEPISTLLLVEDEDDIRDALVRRLTEGGYQVVEAATPDEAIKSAKKLGKGGVRFILIADLGMPTSGGASFQGGFEVIKRLWKMKQRPVVALMTESVSAAIRARAKQMGVRALLFKPGLSRLDADQFESDLTAFGDQLATRVLPRLQDLAAGIEAPKQSARGEPAPLASRSTPEELSVLQRRLQQLRRPSDATQISALVMRVAREFFERGILFLIKEEEVRGLGGFGPAGRGENLNLLVRQVSIPLAEPSIFRESAARGKPFRGALPEGRWNQHLMGKIGRFRSSEVALLPLVAYREPIALLFGDNPDTGRPLERLETLEIFITQAAIALENAFLQRKLAAIGEES